MFNAEWANYLLALEKYVVENGKLLNNKQIIISNPMRLKLYLAVQEDKDQSFLVDIKETAKKLLKISLYHQDNKTNNGIIRLDYNSRHINPRKILPTVPKRFIPFAGKDLKDYPGHIHYEVDGYKKSCLGNSFGSG